MRSCPVSISGSPSPISVNIKGSRNISESRGSDVGSVSCDSDSPSSTIISSGEVSASTITSSGEGSPSSTTTSGAVRSVFTITTPTIQGLALLKYGYSPGVSNV